MGDGCTRRRLTAPLGSWVSVSAPCRETALHLASRNGHTEIVTALLEKGAAVNAERENKCVFSFFLVSHGRRLHAPAKAVRLFDSWLSVSAPCRHTALHLASRNGHTEIVTALIEKGADVKAEDGSGETAFHVARDPRAFIAAVEVRSVCAIAA
jgi:hypothetical protein